MEYEEVVRGMAGNCRCLLCEHVERTSRDAMLKHVIETHHLVIAEAAQIADLSAYMEYWRDRLSSGLSLPDIASTIDTAPIRGVQDEGVRYYLLSDVLDEDKRLREKLQQERLNKLLELQQHERNDCCEPWVCLFCKGVAHDTRDELFAHMLENHGFNVGLPDNIVFVRQFLAAMQSVLDKCQCLYCEKFFPSHAILRSHMRKKHHFKINPKNTQWDLYYLVNYLELGKNWENIGNEQDVDSSRDDGDDNWGDWNDCDIEETVCLFCAESTRDAHDVIQHMRSIHSFALGPPLDFYQSVKAVNFLRRQRHLRRCGYCEQQFEDSESLVAHLESDGHCKLPEDAQQWDQPQYFFSTYENDPLLFALEGDLEEEDEPPAT